MKNGNWIFLYDINFLKVATRRKEIESLETGIEIQHTMKLCHGLILWDNANKNNAYF